MISCALTIAASDPSGGAGVEMDIKVFTAFGVFGMSAITALTVQTTGGMVSAHPCQVKVFREILDGLARDIKISAIKIGAIATAAHAEAVAEFLDKLEGVPSVLDPVMMASSGASLAEPGTEKAVSGLLVPRVSLVTPNLAEAEVLTGTRILEKSDMRKAAEALCRLGAGAALVKGGHLAGEPADVLFTNHGIREWKSRRLKGEFHGTGCALSAAIAACLAKGEDMQTAVADARKYLRRLMKESFRGSGKARILFPVTPG